MDSLGSSIFSLPDRLSRKADPALVETDERHLAAIARSLEESTATLSARLAEQRKVVAGDGPDALERDDEIRHLTARLRTLRRYGQRKVMIEQGWTVDEFRFHFGKNYLDDEELEEIAAIQAESA